MRELYATELSSGTDRNEAARGYVNEWVNRHTGLRGSSVEASVAENNDGSCTITLRQIDQASGLEWRSDVSLGRPSELAHVTVRIRLGSLGGGAIAPIDYEFGTPAIVRTLLRDLDVRDGSVRCAADLDAEIGPSAVPQLVSLLTDTDRTWPVVVVSRAEPSGATLVDPSKLCRELAGLAHVRVLSSSATSWELTNTIGKEYSVWRGAVRVFFAGFSGEGDDFRRHRVTFPDRVDDDTVARLRTWLGTLSAAATQDHPAVRLQRVQRRALVLAAVESDDADELREWIGILEEDNGRLAQDAEDYKQRAAELRKQLSRTESDLEQVRDNFAEMQRSMESPPTSEIADVEADGWPATMAQAMDAVEELAATASTGEAWSSARPPCGRVAGSAATPGPKNSYEHARQCLRLASCTTATRSECRQASSSTGGALGTQPSRHLT